jgi:hypothetical protein
MSGVPSSPSYVGVLWCLTLLLSTSFEIHSCCIYQSFVLLLIAIRGSSAGTGHICLVHLLQMDTWVVPSLWLFGINLREVFSLGYIPSTGNLDI